MQIFENLHPYEFTFCSTPFYKELTIDESYIRVFIKIFVMITSMLVVEWHAGVLMRLNLTGFVDTFSTQGHRKN